MRRFKTVTVAGISLLGVILLAGTAFSQTSAASEVRGIDPTPIIVALINLVFPAVAAVATYLINAHVKDQQLAAQLSNAVQNAIGTVQQNAADSLKGKTELRLAASDPAIQKGVQYVIDNAAEAIARFKIPEERIAQSLKPRSGSQQLKRIVPLPHRPCRA